MCNEAACEEKRDLVADMRRLIERIEAGENVSVGVVWTDDSTQPAWVAYNFHTALHRQWPSLVRAAWDMVAHIYKSHYRPAPAEADAARST